MMSRQEGLFITFEGLEGAGKSTQARRLVEHLRGEGYPAVLTREPGGTPLGEAIRRILADPDHGEMDELTEVLLFAAARRQHVQQVIRPHLQEGAVVVCDRFSDATLAYQGFGRGVHLTLIRELDETITWGVRPDLTFYLDIDPYQSLSRVRERYRESDQPPDRLERLQVSFFERVREGYLEIVREEPSRVRMLDAQSPPEEVHRRIVDTVMREVHRRLPYPDRLTMSLDELQS